MPCRWDANAVNELPEYMRVCYLALLDVYVEMEEELANTGELYRVDYAKTEVYYMFNQHITCISLQENNKILTSNFYLHIFPLINFIFLVVYPYCICIYLKTMVSFGYVIDAKISGSIYERRQVVS